jgi:glycosyltransferase involved in cell wall biosynthesis
MDKVQKSILGPAAVETRVISLGIDLSVFRPDEKNAVRESLGLPQDRRILLFAANGIRNNMWKDYETMRTAVAKLAERVEGTNLLFIALGEDAHAEQIDRAEVRFVPFQSDRHVVAQYFQAADVYVHASRIDTSPTAVLEALACGTPVVATGVGGIPEQIRDGVTGYIVPPGGAESMASSIERLLGNQEHCLRMGENAFKDARARFDLKDEAKAYLSWYQAVTEAKQGEPKNKATSIRNEQ